MSAKILLVNVLETDNLIIKSALSEHLILSAYNHLDAVNIIESNHDISLVILDLSVLVEEGIEFLNKLNSDLSHRNIVTIIITNYSEPENEIKGLKNGAWDYIRKPIQKESFKARIKLHLELIKQQTIKQDADRLSKIYNAIFHQAPIGISISYNSDSLDNSKKKLYINPAYERITGRTKEEFAKIGWEKMTHPDDLDEDLKNFRKLKSGEIKSYSMEKRYLKPDGSVVWVQMVVAPLILSDDTKFNHFCMIKDITEQKEVEKALMESRRSKSVLLSHLPGLAYRCNFDKDWTMQYVSDGCYELTGYKPECLLYNRDLSFNELIAPEYRETLWKEWEHILQNKMPFKYEYEITTANGKRKWVLEMGEGVYNEKGEIEALEGIILDISDRKKMEDNLRYNSEHDTWTGLLNRRCLINLLNQEINSENKRAIVGINLSAINILNMSYGFSYSQELVKKLANDLKVHCSDNHLLFNTYENRFVFYIKNYKDRKEINSFCKAMINTLEPSLSIERVSVGIGVVEINDNNKHDADKLLKDLLIASEKSTIIFENDYGFCFFDEEMEAEIIREENIKQEINCIINDKDFGSLCLKFQPILDLKTNKIYAFEALARINSETLGFITPLEFIPIAEKTKQIIQLGDKIIKKALLFWNMLKENGYEYINITINISVIQLLKKDFAANFIKMINDMQVNPEKIGIEITESVFVKDVEEVNKIICILKDYGINVLIDDFGTGYSSLARERELNVNILKIDKFFIDKLLVVNPEKTITNDIISMAHKLGHSVVAEGVEYEKQIQYLINCGCDKIQGYLISKPLEENDALAFLKKFNR